MVEKFWGMVVLGAMLAGWILLIYNTPAALVSILAVGGSVWAVFHLLRGLSD